MSLQDVVSKIVVGYDPVRVPTNSTSTAPYSPRLDLPPMSKRPYHILYRPSLLQDMLDGLNNYLQQTAPGANNQPSQFLTLQITDISSSESITNAQLSHEPSTTEKWTHHYGLIKNCVREIDLNMSFPEISMPAMIYSQTPNTIIHSTTNGRPRIHKEDKSWLVFETHAPNILRMAQEIDGNGGFIGTRLEMATTEFNHRSIIFKIGISMTSTAGGPIPYAILFGGDQFMIFSLFEEPNTIGAIRYGLFCSDIIKVSDIASPFIPLVTFMLLGRDTPAPLPSSKLAIPVCIDDPVLESETIVTRAQGKRYSLTDTLKMSKMDSAAISFQTPGVLEERTFTVVRQHVQMSASSTASSFNPLKPPPAPWPDIYISTLHSTPSSIENPEHIAYAEPEKHVTTSTEAVSTDLKLQLNLTERIGHGVAGHVFMGTADGEPMIRYAVKLAPYDDGKTMLFNEASIYECLKPLQGQCVALVFGYFTSKTAHALVMEYLGCETNDMNTFTHSQRAILWEELCLIHGMGVMHGDLRLANIVILDGSDPHFIDFTHGALHNCEGPENCEELIRARKFLLLLDDSDGNNQ